MKFKGILETVIYFRDLENSSRFYKDILQLQVFSEKKGAFTFFKLGQTMLLLFSETYAREQHNLPTHFAVGDQHFAFSVGKEEYLQWKKYLSDEVGIEHVEDWGSGVESFYFRDPEGNVLEIAGPGLWGIDHVTG
jgi:catechol-2,3-dioxygenase